MKVAVMGHLMGSRTAATMVLTSDKMKAAMKAASSGAMTAEWTAVMWVVTTVLLKDVMQVAALVEMWVALTVAPSVVLMGATTADMRVPTTVRTMETLLASARDAKSVELMVGKSGVLKAASLAW